MSKTGAERQKEETRKINEKMPKHTHTHKKNKNNFVKKYV